MSRTFSPRQAGIADVGPPGWFSTAHVVLRHVGAVAALVLFPLNRDLLLLVVVSYLLRIWGMEAVYHRYFSHRSYKTSRVFQFLLALVGVQSGQRGPLWWAYVHRVHHRHADMPADRHSPVAHGFARAYFGWMRQPDFRRMDWRVVADFARYPELRWLTRFYEVPLELVGALLALAGYLGWLGPNISGASAFLWGYCVPLVLVLHATAFVNTFCHLSRVPGGYQRYARERHSVNRPVLSFLMLGAGYHNNHHRMASLARAGFAWHEPDVTLWTLRVLRTLRLVDGVRDTVPDAVLREGGIGAGRRALRADAVERGPTARDEHAS